uniref:Uncharacterized protein n=1 Tax=Arundo donax TaxID=35708 RepID=A0A0A8Z066_ARUDO
MTRFYCSANRRTHHTLSTVMGPTIGLIVKSLLCPWSNRRTKHAWTTGIGSTISLSRNTQQVWLLYLR